ncbi:MAG: DUF2065 domain-containing protein [Desulfobacterium sp.]|jgi:uncharacterized protein|nr:DUF2065 domain-containing protein [Desulfobacterium sp.]
MTFFLCVIGMVMILEGLPYFAFPEKIKFFILKITDTPDQTLRVIGLLLMLSGLGLVYLGKQIG